MVSDLPRQAIFVAVLLFFSAFYSAAETAITAAGRARLLSLKEQYGYLSRFVDWVLEERQQVLSTILIANNLVNIAASAVGTSLATQYFQVRGVLWAVVIMTLLIVIFGEVLPKSVALVKTSSLLPVLLPAVRFTCLLFMPLVWVMTTITTLLSKVFGIDMTLENSLMTREEIEHVVKIGEASGVLEESERRMIDGIISFEETRVSEIMVPRTDIDMLELNESIENAVAFAQQCGRSRIPICEDSPDDIVGILYVKDLLPHLAGGAEISIEAVMRKPLFVPETMRIQDLFSIMRNQRVHLAVAVDEYGGTAGIVSMEDLIEEIVGEIQDEYDQEKTPIEKIEEGCYKVQGSVCLEDLGDIVDWPFESEEVDSVGGYVLDQFGNFPHKGDKVEVKGWTIEVLDVSDHRVNEVLFRRRFDEDDNE